MTSKRTAKQIAADIQANVNRMYDETDCDHDDRDAAFAEFNARQRTLWDEAQARGQAFADRVRAALR